MKFLTLAVPATLAMGVVAMPTPSTSKAARLSGENLLDGLANDGGLSGFLSGVHLPFLNPSPKKDSQDPSDEDPDDVPAGDDKGPGADDGNNGDGPADPIYGSEDSAGVGAGTQNEAEK